MHYISIHAANWPIIKDSRTKKKKENTLERLNRKI